MSDELGTPYTGNPYNPGLKSIKAVHAENGYDYYDYENHYADSQNAMKSIGEAVCGAGVSAELTAARFAEITEKINAAEIAALKAQVAQAMMAPQLVMVPEGYVQNYAQIEEPKSLPTKAAAKFEWIKKRKVLKP